MTLALLITGGALAAIALALVRLVQGPHQADRIVALDVVFAATIALSAAASLVSERALFLDIGVGLAVVGFVATLVWARLIAASVDDALRPEPPKPVSPEPRPQPSEENA